jgi:hypothetical protein
LGRQAEWRLAFGLGEIEKVAGGQSRENAFP